jgi:hypothetical protein
MDSPKNQLRKNSYSLITKTRKKNKFRSSTVMVLKMLFFGIKNVLYLKKMFVFQEKIMIFPWKSNIFDTLSILNLNPNEKNNTFSKSVGFFYTKNFFLVCSLSRPNFLRGGFDSNLTDRNRCFECFIYPSGNKNNNEIQI